MGYNKITGDAITMLMRVHRRRRHHNSSAPHTPAGTVLFFISAVLILIAFKSDIINRAVSNKTLASVLRIFVAVAGVLMLIGSAKAG